MFLLIIYVLSSHLYAKTFCIGHKNPDTDSVVSAILASKMYNCVPAIAGELNNETKFVLETLGIEPPEVITKHQVGNKVILVDHNSPTHAIDGLIKEDVIGIIDHHPFSGESFLKVGDPRVTHQVMGSTSTLIAQEMKMIAPQNAFDSSVARLIVAGIVSDTINLSSNATREADRKVLLKATAEAHFNEVGSRFDDFVLEMFKKKSDLSQLNEAQIIMNDWKRFDDQKMGFGVAQTVAPDELLTRKSELLLQMELIREQEGLEYVFFMVTDTRSVADPAYNKPLQSYFLVSNNREATMLTETFGDAVEDMGDNVFAVKTGQTSKKFNYAPELLNQIEQTSSHPGLSLIIDSQGKCANSVNVMMMMMHRL
ncbi:MAG: DHH family phosphoesterase [Bacteriovoracaceae bacterium]|nr:DHH family phosphoesterase [Bacteriovoracaceae bacterium]